jgi:hypothetical protein
VGKKWNLNHHPVKTGVKEFCNVLKMLDSGFVRNTPINPPNPPLSKGGEGGFHALAGAQPPRSGRVMVGVIFGEGF